MKRLYVLSVMIVFLVSPSLIFAGNELVWEKKLPFDTATIHYSIKGIEEGTETLFIRDNGKERATYRDTVSNMMGKKMSNKTIIFKTPEFIFTYDLEKKKGVKGINPQQYMIEEYSKLSANEKEKVRKNSQKIGTAFSEGMGGTIEPNAMQLLGNDCDKMEIVGGSSTYLLHDTDIVLKTEINMMGMKLTMVADLIDKGNVDDKVFQHPAGITAETNPETDKMAKIMARQAIAMLKEPENMKKTEMIPQLTVPGEQPEMSKEDKKMMQQVQQMMQEMKGERPHPQ